MLSRGLLFLLVVSFSLSSPINREEIQQADPPTQAIVGREKAAIENSTAAALNPAADQKKANQSNETAAVLPDVQATEINASAISNKQKIEQKKEASNDSVILPSAAVKDELNDPVTENSSVLNEAVDKRADEESPATEAPKNIVKEKIQTISDQSILKDADKATIIKKPIIAEDVDKRADEESPVTEASENIAEKETPRISDKSSKEVADKATITEKAVIAEDVDKRADEESPVTEASKNIAEKETLKISDKLSIEDADKITISEKFSVLAEDVDTEENIESLVTEVSENIEKEEVSKISDKPLKDDANKTIIITKPTVPVKDADERADEEFPATEASKNISKENISESSDNILGKAEDEATITDKPSVLDENVEEKADEESPATEASKNVAEKKISKFSEKPSKEAADKITTIENPIISVEDADKRTDENSPATEASKNIAEENFLEISEESLNEAAKQSENIEKPVTSENLSQRKADSLVNNTTVAKESNATTTKIDDVEQRVHLSNETISSVDKEDEKAEPTTEVSPADRDSSTAEEAPSTEKTTEVGEDERHLLLERKLAVETFESTTTVYDERENEEITESPEDEIANERNEIPTTTEKAAAVEREEDESETTEIPQKDNQSKVEIKDDSQSKDETTEAIVTVTQSKRINSKIDKNIDKAQQQIESEKSADPVEEESVVQTADDNTTVIPIASDTIREDEILDDHTEDQEITTEASNNAVVRDVVKSYEDAAPIQVVEIIAPKRANDNIVPENSAPIKIVEITEEVDTEKLNSTIAIKLLEQNKIQPQISAETKNKIEITTQSSQIPDSVTTRDIEGNEDASVDEKTEPPKQKIQPTDVDNDYWLKMQPDDKEKKVESASEDLEVKSVASSNVDQSGGNKTEQKIVKQNDTETELSKDVVREENAEAVTEITQPINQATNQSEIDKQLDKVAQKYGLNPVNKIGTDTKPVTSVVADVPKEDSILLGSENRNNFQESNDLHRRLSFGDKVVRFVRHIW